MPRLFWWSHLFALCVTCVRSEDPVFCTTSPCIVNVTHGHRLAFVRSDLSVEIDPLPAEYYIPAKDCTAADNISFHVYYQIAYCHIDGTQPPTNSMYMALVGNPDEYTVTASELLRLPIVQFHLHGDFWNQQGFFWIFTIAAEAMAFVYILTARVQFWQLLVILGMGAFVAIAAENLYHTIEQTRSAKMSQSQLVFAYAGTAIGANLIPFVFCIAFLRYSRQKNPLVWSIVALLVAVGSVFLGAAGWYVGPGLLGLGAIVKVVQRYTK